MSITFIVECSIVPYRKLLYSLRDKYLCGFHELQIFLVTKIPTAALSIVQDHDCNNCTETTEIWTHYMVFSHTLHCISYIVHTISCAPKVTILPLILDETVTAYLMLGF